MSNLITIALGQIGIKEFSGKRDNPEVLKYFHDLGFDSQKIKDETSWCSAFMNWVAKTAGYEFSGGLNARSWLKVGKKIKNPQVGDVVVFWRESEKSWKGHVGIYLREDSLKIYVLGGNQKNQVCVQPYWKAQLLGYRRISPIQYTANV